MVTATALIRTSVRPVGTGTPSAIRAVDAVPRPPTKSGQVKQASHDRLRLWLLPVVGDNGGARLNPEGTIQVLERFDGPPADEWRPTEWSEYPITAKRSARPSSPVGSTSPRVRSPSRIPDDIRVSTLRQYLEALGARLIGTTARQRQR